MGDGQETCSWLLIITYHYHLALALLSLRFRDGVGQLYLWVRLNVVAGPLKLGFLVRVGGLASFPKAPNDLGNFCSSLG